RIDQRMTSLVQDICNGRSAEDGRPSGFERTRQRNRPPTFVRRQVGIARRQREAVGLAHGRYANDLYGDGEVLDHATNDHELLEVLLAEQRDSGAHGQKEPGDDGRDAIEMTRTSRSLPSF